MTDRMRGLLERLMLDKRHPPRIGWEALSSAEKRSANALVRRGLAMEVPFVDGLALVATAEGVVECRP